MDKAELSEIRARLRADTEMERRRPRRPLLAPLRVLLGPPAAAAAPKPSYPTPRRVGLNPAPLVEAEAELVLAEPIETTGRNAFGQRTEPAQEALPLLRLTVPEPPVAVLEVVEAPRWESMLAKVRPASAVTETPYRPEDFSDPAEGEAERLYAAAGLAKVDPVEPVTRLRVMREPEPEPPPPAALTAEQELLMHIERVLLVEFATVEARRLPG